MSMNIHVIPTPHATMRTTIIKRLTDGQLQTRVENPIGTVIDKFFNFAANSATTSVYSEGDAKEINIDPVNTVWVDKKGTDAFFYFEVKEYYDQASTNPPIERDLWYGYNVDAKDAPDFDSSFTQDDPTYFLWSSGGTPEAPTYAFNPTTSENTKLASTYVELGSTTARREYLKEKLLAKYTDPDIPAIFMGSSLLTIAPEVSNFTLPAGQAPNNHVVTQSKEHSRAQQSFIFRLEMLTRAISADVNLSTEAKFNLLDGEISLDNWAVFLKVDRSLNGLINSTGNRTSWNFFRLGSVANVTPYTYTPPSINTGSWTATNDTSIDVASAPPRVLNTNNIHWLTWLRS